MRAGFGVSFLWRMGTSHWSFGEKHRDLELHFGWIIENASSAATTQTHNK
jgi:hypothetical protein